MTYTVDLDKWYAHESLDRTYMILDMFDEYVIKHPFVNQSHDLLAQARELESLMCDLYQAIAREGDKYESVL